MVLDIRKDTDDLDQSAPKAEATKEPQALQVRLLVLSVHDLT
jgi:hypothetical protein